MKKRSSKNKSYASNTEPPTNIEERDVEARGLWLSAGRLYLVAYCRKAKALRSFAAQRIIAANVLETTFERDESFSLEAWTKQAFGTYQDEIRDVVIEFAPEVAHLPRERSYHATQRLESLKEGGVRLSFTASGLPEIAAWVASFGGKVRAVEPAELREAVTEIHRAGLAVSLDDVGEG